MRIESKTRDGLDHDRERALRLSSDSVLPMFSDKGVTARI